VAISATARGVPTSQSTTDEPDFSSVLAETNAANAKPPNESDPRTKAQTAAAKQSSTTAIAAESKSAGQSIAGTMPKIADPKQTDSGQTKSPPANPKKASTPTDAQSSLMTTQKRDAPLPPFIGGMQTGPIFSESKEPLPEATGDHSEADGSPSPSVPADGTPSSSSSGEDQNLTADASAALQGSLFDALTSSSGALTSAPASKGAATPQLQGKTPGQLNALLQSLQPTSHCETSAPAAQAQTPASQSDASSTPQPTQKQGNDNGASSGGHNHGDQARNANDGSSSQTLQQSPDAANATVTTPVPVAANNGMIANPAASDASGLSANVGTQNSGAAASGTALQVAPQTNAQAVQPDLNALAINIAAKSQAGAKQFDISLEPAELGRVEVRLTVDNAGNAQAHLVAERPETLQMLQRDSATLSHALKESGVQLGDNGLQFSLKGQERQGDGAQQGASRARPLSVSAAPSAQSIHPVSSSYGLSLSRAGIDIRV
jgi:flagellar hook-length control protein FliK